MKTNSNQYWFGFETQNRVYSYFTYLLNLSQANSSDSAKIQICLIIEYKLRTYGYDGMVPG